MLKTPLHQAHIQAGGRMVEFAGYEMPVQYSSIIAESQEVRKGAGMFDVSHMARLTLTGDQVLEYLEQITTNDVAKLGDLQGQYSMLPNATGGVIDDIIVYRMAAKEYRMVVNASNHAKDVAHMKSQNSFGVEIEDNTAATAMIAVQGPQAVPILAKLSDKSDEIQSSDLFGVIESKIAGIDCFCARSGYTGEDGYELVCAADQAESLWNHLLEAGVKPCGLGSRDVLRVEAGLPLYGHELSDEMSPISAGLGWVISKTKEFLGSEPINQARKEKTPQLLKGIRMEGRRIPNPEMPVLVDGIQVGSVSSGVYSPMLECGIAFAFVDRDVDFGTACTVDLRGKHEPGEIVNKRFMKKDA